MKWIVGWVTCTLFYNFYVCLSLCVNLCLSVCFCHIIYGVSLHSYFCLLFCLLVIFSVVYSYSYRFSSFFAFAFLGACCVCMLSPFLKCITGTCLQTQQFSVPSASLSLYVFMRSLNLPSSIVIAFLSLSCVVLPVCFLHYFPNKVWSGVIGSNSTLLELPIRSPSFIRPGKTNHHDFFFFLCSMYSCGGLKFSSHL